MSSSRRSSRSTRSNRPPTWRSISISKKSAPVSLSLVFGEPQQAAPLASATSKLPVVSSSPECAAPDENPTLARTSAEKSTSVSELSVSGTVGGRGGDETNGINPEIESSNQQSGATEVAPREPVPSDAAERSIQNSRASSWFYPLKHIGSKNKFVKMAMLPEAVGSPDDRPPRMAQTDGQSSNALDLSRHIPSSPRNPEPPAVPRLSESNQPSSFESFASPVPPRGNTPLVDQPIVPYNTSTPVPLLVDDGVVRPSSAVPIPSPSAPDPSTKVNDEAAGSPQRSPPHTPISKFTISIPLLGRPKLPLEKAIIQAESTKSDEVSASNSITATAPLVSDIETTQDSTVAAPEEDSANPNELDETGATPPLSKGETQETSTSWWGYVGWGSTVKLDPTSAAEVEKGPDATQSKPPCGDGLSVTAEPLISPNSASIVHKAATQPGAPQEEISDVMAEIKVDTSLGAPDSKATASSLRSVNTSQSQGSAWYAPWSWYSYAAPSSALLPAGIAPGTPAESSHSQKTQSEMVKDAALAREAAEMTEAHPQVLVESQQKTSDAEPNPIAASIESNRSGWASFFTTRTLTVKSLTNNGEPSEDENGMEVMDIDEEEDTQAKRDQNSGAVGIVISSQRSKSTKQAEINLPTPLVQPSSPTKNHSSSGQIVAPPLTLSDSLKPQVAPSRPTNKQNSAPASLKKSGTDTPTPRIPPANLILPSWSDTFHTHPRNILPPPPTSRFTKAVKFFGEVLFSNDGHAIGKGKERERDEHFAHFGRQLPRAWDVIEDHGKVDLQGYDNVVVIGIHGWFPGAIMRTVLGEPTGTSTKFVNMMTQALDEFQHTHDIKFKKVTKIPLEGEGTIAGRVDKLYNALLSNQNWMDDIHAADALFVATHSQGSVVSTHLLDRLIRDKHIRTSRNIAIPEAESLPIPSGPLNSLRPQKICCLALCGIHLGPLRYLSSSSLLQPYIQYFESTAARELFDFQNTNSEVSKAYLGALGNILNHGTKLVYVASLNDQVVPIYSGLFTAISHPLILRALYIDGDAYHSSDFLSNLLVLLLRVLNSGISDSGLLAHLSEATAGSLNGVGHSTAYEELGTYSLAVKYLFLTNDGLEEHSELNVEPFNATAEQNDYEIPWALRDLIADPRVMHFFSREVTELRDAFRDWHPRTTILRDIKRKLQPIQRLPSSIYSTSSSKL